MTSRSAEKARHSCLTSKGSPTCTACQRERDAWRQMLTNLAQREAVDD